MISRCFPKGETHFFSHVIVEWGGCGASLIHGDIALTAAHVSEGCMSSFQK